MDALKSDPLSLLYILTSAMRVGIFRGALGNIRRKVILDAELAVLPWNVGADSGEPSGRASGFAMSHNASNSFFLPMGDRITNAPCQSGIVNPAPCWENGTSKS
jgi:hypothetical protein